MEGPEKKALPFTADDDMEEVGGDGRGVIPRAMEQIFESVQSLREQGWEVQHYPFIHKSIKDQV